MEKLSFIGKKHKRILATFLKVNNAYATFIRNHQECRTKQKMSCGSIKEVFNTSNLTDLFEEFFNFGLCEHPSTMNSHYDRYVYWMDLYQKWKEFCYYQKYKYEYGIW